MDFLFYSLLFKIKILHTNTPKALFEMKQCRRRLKGWKMKIVITLSIPNLALALQPYCLKLFLSAQQAVQALSSALYSPQASWSQQPRHCLRKCCQSQPLLETLQSQEDSKALLHIS